MTMTDVREPGAPPRGRRRWRNFFVKPGLRFRYTWYFVGGGLLIFGATTALIQRRLSEVVALTNAGPMLSMAEQSRVQDLFVEITKVSLAGFSAYLVFSFVVAFVLSHRVSGPIVAIVDVIAQFQQGNFGYRRPIRRYDELKEIHGELIALGEALEAQGQRSAVPSLTVVDGSRGAK
jgi:HAMP domain-containing protein